MTDIKRFECFKVKIEVCFMFPQTDGLGEFYLGGLTFM